MRTGLVAGAEKAGKDPKVSSIVVCGKGNFIAGADIREFATGESRQGKFHNIRL